MTWRLVTPADITTAGPPSSSVTMLIMCDKSHVTPFKLICYHLDLKTYNRGKK